jgi:hypothetical protein
MSQFLEVIWLENGDRRFMLRLINLRRGKIRPLFWPIINYAILDGCTGTIIGLVFPAQNLIEIRMNGQNQLTVQRAFIYCLIVSILKNDKRNSTEK